MEEKTDCQGMSARDDWFYNALRYADDDGEKISESKRIKIKN